jgi:DNA polymerase-3 subunit alpha (Gram-positive type)
MLEEMIGISAKDIPFSDPDTLSLFSSTAALGIKPEELGVCVGTFGIPEFGTKFVMQMLEETKPRCFSDLVRISGYSHGEDVWRKNAQDLIKSGTAQVSETIAARDDIMLFLMQKGVPPTTAFKVMEDVRKGNGVKPEYQVKMREHGVPEWYIESCQKIKYMFPKAHAVAYVMMACRIAYCKVHHPLEFYAACFTRRVDDFDAGVILAGRKAVDAEIKRIEEQYREKKAADKEKKMLNVLELAREMDLRKMRFQNVHLYKSHPTNFVVADGSLLPPLRVIDGLGEKAACNIALARQDGEFLSRDDLRRRAGINKAVLAQLVWHGCLAELPDSNQLALF